MHFTPTYSSWLNQVDDVPLLTDKQLRRGVHTSVYALEKDIRDWITTWNQDPKPFAWTKTADDILERLASYLHRIPGAGTEDCYTLRKDTCPSAGGGMGGPEVPRSKALSR